MEDKQIFDTLFRKYYEPLFYFARQYVADDDECRDIVEGVFEHLWSRQDAIELSTVRAMLYTEVHNRCIDHLRHEKQKAQYVEFAEHHSQRYIIDKEYDTQQTRERIVTQVLDSLGEPTHSILVACYVDGKKYQEVADSMGISISTVKKYMVRALQQIREMRKKWKWDV